MAARRSITEPNIGGGSPSPASPRRLHRILLPLTLVLAFLLAAGGVLFAWYALSIEKSVTDNITRQADTLPAEDAPARPAKTKQRRDRSALNFVLLGADQSQSGASRSDALMVIHLNADRSAVSIISFPRDMWVDVPGHGKAKINAAYAWGGSKLAVQTLEQMLDVRMEHLAIIDFDGFIKLTDDLGGVTVNNRHYSKSGPYIFPVGELSIRGDQALAYVRERKQLPGGDFDRAERQRLVVQAILAKGMAKEIIANPAKFTKFVSGVAKNLTVDSGLTDKEIRKIALSLRLTGDDVALLQAPVKGLATSKDGQSIDVVNRARIAELGDALRKDQLDRYVERYPSG